MKVEDQKPRPSGRGAIIYVPVADKDGSPLLWDIYIDGVWHGSRRLLAQCEDYVRPRR
jgi:hypothetical protein